MNLLIVDDNATIRRMMITLLSDLADEIHECANGAEAMVSYGLHHHDWILMDIEMPVCDGLAATRRIKEDSPDVRIIIVTSHNSRVLRQAARDAGACAYILKDDLRDIHTILTGKKDINIEIGNDDEKKLFFRTVQLNNFSRFLSLSMGLTMGLTKGLTN